MSKKLIPLLCLLLLCLQVPGSAQQLGRIPFFAFNNGIRDQQRDTPEKQVQLLKSLGYDGMEMKQIEEIPQTLAALDKAGMKLYAIYLNIDLDNKEQPYDKNLKEAFRLLQGRGTMPWFYITSKQYPPSSAAYDSVAVPILQEIADMAAASGVKVMIYPHYKNWVESVDDAVRVAQKVNRRNLGITFNLCHYLASQGLNAEKNFLPTVEKAMPYVFAISLNGADKPSAANMQSKNLWQHLIQPLGQGNYDTYRYLNTFIERGFKGPVGLQCYNIQEAKPLHLKKSMAAWRNFERQLSAKR